MALPKLCDNNLGTYKNSTPPRLKYAEVDSGSCKNTVPTITAWKM